MDENREEWREKKNIERNKGDVRFMKVTFKYGNPATTLIK